MLDSKYLKIPLSKDLILETNFSDASKPCKLFKFNMGGKETVITRDELFGLLFMFGDEKQQEDLIPVISTKVKSISRMLTFKLKKDMRKGETVKAAYEYFMPEAIVEKLLLTDPERYQPGNLSTNKLEKDVNKIV